MLNSLHTTVCWAAKGGSGTTVIVASAALSAERPVLIVDLDGDQPTALGLAEPDGPGLLDWVASDAPATRLAALETTVTDHVSLLPRGSNRATGERDRERWTRLATWLSSESRTVIIDAGTRPTIPPELIAGSHQSVLVTRPCYLAVRAAARFHLRPTGIVVVREPRRSLTIADIEVGIGAPVVAEVLLDPAIARAVDAGLLAGRLPGRLTRALRAAA